MQNAGPTWSVGLTHPLLVSDRFAIVGHRGNAAHAPENTIESFSEAVALGVDALELDVRVSGDGHVIVIHDPTLDRTTDRTGPVHLLPLADVKAADAGARFTPDGGATFPWRGEGVQVPTLREVLDTFPDTPLLIEIKSADAAQGTLEIIESHDAMERCIVASFDWRALEPFRGTAIRRGASRRDTARLFWRAIVRQPPERVDFDVMCMPPAYRGLPLPVGGYAAILAPHEVPVHVWTVDDPAEARALRGVGVRGIISNDPARVRGEA